jgi:hypothetical protein
MTAATTLARTVLLTRDFVPEDVSDDEVVRALTETSVCLVADATNVATAAGQTALITLASHVLRMGCRLRLVVPRAAIVGDQPPLRGSELRDALVDLGADILEEPRAEVVTSAAPEDLVFVLGDSCWSGRGRAAWRLAGTRWSGGTSEVRQSSGPWLGSFPMGAAIAATVAAAEPYKAAVRRAVGKRAIVAPEQIHLVQRASVRLAEEDVCSGGVDIGPLDCVSAGAIVEAFLHSLLRVPDACARVRVIEPECLEDGNLNRYPLGRRSDLGDMKAALAARYSTDRIEIEGVPVLFDAEAARRLPLSARVVVGTDDIPSRWVVQRLQPRWLCVGATHHFSSLVSEHDRTSACAGCLHTLDDDENAPVATVSFVSYWAGLLLLSRVLRVASGAPLGSRERAHWVTGLRLDLPRAEWRHGVERHPRCPVHCVAA